MQGLKPNYFGINSARLKSGPDYHQWRKPRNIQPLSAQLKVDVRIQVLRSAQTTQSPQALEASSSFSRHGHWAGDGARIVAFYSRGGFGFFCRLALFGPSFLLWLVLFRRFACVVRTRQYRAGFEVLLQQIRAAALGTLFCHRLISRGELALGII